MRRLLGSVVANVVLCAVAVVSLGDSSRPAHASTTQKQPSARGTGGAIATVDHEASRAGLRILKKGGNAIDAAVAAAAVLGVTEPYSCGIGGGGFMMIYRASTRTVSTIDHREMAPAVMHPESFMENDQPLAFNDARFSGLSTGAPGTVRGWAKALRRYGTMSLQDVLAPAITVARRGFEVDQVFSDQTQANIPYFDDVTSTKELFLDDDGTPPDIGTIFRNPDLARTYERIADRGAREFYRGRIADEIVDAVQTPPLEAGADHVWRAGVMEEEDLRGYAALERAPTQVDYRGFDVYGMGPPSSGGSTVGESLNILEGYDIPGASSEAVLHYLLEASRYSFADRNAYLADPEFFDVPLRGLLSDGFASERRSLITDAAATSPVAPGDPYPHDGSSPRTATEPGATVLRAGSTTHLTVSDRRGNIVSYTFTIESTGGNGIVVPGRGFLLNNELTDFDYSSTTHPNRVEGGKRPRSSMSPTIVLKDSRPVLAVGSPGGSMIITTVLQILVNHLDRGMTLTDAIAAVRLSQRNTTTTVAEPGFTDTPEAQALQQRGHQFTNVAEIGAATGIAFLGGGEVEAAAEPTRRGGGSALVVDP